MQHTLNLPALALPPPGNGWFLIIALLPLLRGCVTTGPIRHPCMGGWLGRRLSRKHLTFLWLCSNFGRPLSGLEDIRDLIC